MPDKLAKLKNFRQFRSEVLPFLSIAFHHFFIETALRFVFLSGALVFIDTAPGELRLVESRAFPGPATGFQKDYQTQAQDPDKLSVVFHFQYLQK